jgi:hypothetical protein
MAALPDHLVSAFPNNTVAGQDQNELIGNVESRDVKSHAAVGKAGGCGGSSPGGVISALSKVFQ